MISDCPNNESPYRVVFGRFQAKLLQCPVNCTLAKIKGRDGRLSILKAIGEEQYYGCFQFDYPEEPADWTIERYISKLNCVLSALAGTRPCLEAGRGMPTYSAFPTLDTKTAPALMKQGCISTLGSRLFRTRRRADRIRIYPKCSPRGRPLAIRHLFALSTTPILRAANGCGNL